LIFVLAVIVGANMWAVMDTPSKASDELSQEIRELIENDAWRT
jgi:hypothetical protein